MAYTQDIRRSDRRRIRPVEFWNFVKPEDTVNETIIYNESELSRCSVFKPFSCSYRKTPKRRLSSFTEKRAKAPKAIEKNDDQSALLVQNSTHSTESLRKKRRLEDVEPPGKDSSQSQTRNEDPKHPAKISRKETQQEGTRSKKDHSSQGDHKQTQSSRLVDTNQNLIGKKPSQRDNSATAVNGVDTAHPPENGRRGRKSKGNSVLSNDSAASQKTRRKQKQRSEELQQEDKESSETPGGEDTGKDAPQTLTRESLEPTSKQEKTRVNLLPKNSSKQPTSFLENSREHQRSIQLTRDTPNTTNFNLTGRDVTQNTTAFEQPSFQNVFSSTAIDAQGKSVFKVPRLPQLRRPPLASLRASTVCLEPSMGTIVEEEESEEHQQKNKEKQKHDKQEKEEQLKKRRKQEQKQQVNELKNQDLQTDREDQGKEQENNEEEEQVQQKGKDGADKVPMQGGEQASGDNGTATATAKTGASQKETPQERMSTAVPPQPQDQESRGCPTQEHTRTEASQRRSSRVRMKPLEFWNFEKVQVEKQQDGEVHIIHQKQDPVKFSIETRTIDCSMACMSQLGIGVTLTTNLLGDTLQFPPVQKKVKGTSAATPTKRKHKISPIKAARSDNNSIYPALSPSQGKRRADPKQVLSGSPVRTLSESPSKKKLFSPQDNFLDKPVDEGSTFRKRIKGGMVVVHIKKFKDMEFMVLEREAYKCYLAQGLQMRDQSIYTGYVFLERGQIIWNTTRKTTIYVIEGYGIVECINGDPGTVYNLKPRATVEFKKRLKLSVKKDGRCKLLKLHLVLGPHL